MFESWSFLCVCRLMYFPKIVIVLCLNSISQNIPCPPLFSQLILKKPNQTSSNIISLKITLNRSTKPQLQSKKSKFNRTTNKLAIKKNTKRIHFVNFGASFAHNEIEGRSENGKR